MDFATIALLALSGFVAGMMNAVAGGGSFVSIPTLIWAGTPAVVANASSCVSLYPAGAASALVYRDELRPIGDAPPWAMIVATAAGGVVGAVLLALTPARRFELLLPWLLLSATLTLAFGRTIGARFHLEERLGASALVPIQLLLGVYCGYFGGAVGIMMMAVWTIAGVSDMRTLHAPRTLLVTAGNTTAVICLAALGQVNWHLVATLTPAAVLGGWAGARLGKRLPAAVTRTGTIAIAAGITALFFARTYL